MKKILYIFKLKKTKYLLFHRWEIDGKTTPWTRYKEFPTALEREQFLEKNLKKLNQYFIEYKNAEEI